MNKILVELAGREGMALTPGGSTGPGYVSYPECTESGYDVTDTLFKIPV